MNDLTRTAKDALFDDQYLSADEMLDKIQQVKFADFQSIFMRTARKKGLPISENDIVKQIYDLSYKSPDMSRINTSTIRGYLNKTKAPSRKTAISFCFEMKLSLSESEEFLRKGFDIGFSPRNADDMICYYCLKHHEPYSKYEELQNWWKKTLAK